MARIDSACYNNELLVLIWTKGVGGVGWCEPENLPVQWQTSTHFHPSWSLVNIFRKRLLAPERCGVTSKPLLVLRGKLTQPGHLLVQVVCQVASQSKIPVQSRTEYFAPYFDPVSTFCYLLQPAKPTPSLELYLSSPQKLFGSSS